ncbi:hypothetical protein PTSG_09012 [Salpingoeca rosetta]|uniref:Tryptophan synthase beta chain-like PALP domain-containing protein n=1 Tax=Salpingoeca rosetta (strain ATCC 50818 / BSB-021) TaxID=946362 RepID=F2ULY6_SALR5|nr:uncharacterized protein PTSG_09012 [Salpingoeca rosetta]EGD78135.1 hypothetical protein PTSG_09012 [Salpingoeca rosetta]|eukprot:XP_004989811.1 hypothetical protein PTSG_09012 [Salpingoeca rosetta]
MKQAQALATRVAVASRGVSPLHTVHVTPPPPAAPPATAAAADARQRGEEGRASPSKRTRVYVKRDDLLRTPLNGNKARKLAWLTEEVFTLPSSSLPHLVSFGGYRSNVLPALSALHAHFHTPCHFWTSQPPPHLEHDVCTPGVQFHHPSKRCTWDELEQLAKSHAASMPDNAVFVAGGGHDTRAELGCRQLAQELAHQLSNLPVKAAVVLFACGNGTTWHYTGQHLHRLMATKFPVVSAGVPVALKPHDLIASVAALGPTAVHDAGNSSSGTGNNGGGGYAGGGNSGSSGSSDIDNCSNSHSDDISSCMMSPPSQSSIPVLSLSKDPDACRAWLRDALWPQHHKQSDASRTLQPLEPLERLHPLTATSQSLSHCVLEPSRRYRFGTPHRRLYELWSHWSRCHPDIPIDLLYMPPVLDVLYDLLPLLHAEHNDDDDDQPDVDAAVVLYHCGGLEGVPSLLSRYHHRFKQR